MFPVIKGAAYTLFHAPNMLLEHGTTQTLDRAKNPDSEYLKKLPEHLRSFEDVVAYPPNQAYIGSIVPKALEGIAKPWYENGIKDASRFAKYGEIMPEDEFYGVMRLVDSFNLVVLEESFAAEIAPKLAQHPAFAGIDLAKLSANTSDAADITKLVDSHVAEAMRLGDRIVGCVRQAHDSDPALVAHIIYENIVALASGVVSLLNL